MAEVGEGVWLVVVCDASELVTVVVVFSSDEWVCSSGSLSLVLVETYVSSDCVR